MEPVVAQIQRNMRSREEDLPQILEEYDKLATEMVDGEKREKVSTSSIL